MNTTLNLVADLLGEYGDNFFSKCPHYRTAKVRETGQIVRLLKYYPYNLSFLTEAVGQVPRSYYVTELSEYVL